MCQQQTAAKQQQLMTSQYTVNSSGVSRPTLATFTSENDSRSGDVPSRTAPTVIATIIGRQLEHQLETHSSTDTTGEQPKARKQDNNNNNNGQNQNQVTGSTTNTYHF
jgi:hypothetical protein